MSSPENTVDHYLGEFRAGRYDDAFHGLIEADPEVISELINAYEDTTDLDTKVFVIEVISEFRLDSSLYFLRHALRRDDPRIWKAALNGMAMTESPEAVDAMDRVLSSIQDTYRHIVSCLICLVMVATANANDLPAKYSAFKKYLGDWSGTVEYEIRTPKGIEKFKSLKSSKCHFDQKRDAIVMNDTEIVPWAKEKVEASAEIRWDDSSKRFKMIHWGTDGGVRLVVIELRGESLLFQQVDPAPGEKLESEVSINREGKLVEKGQMSSHVPAGTNVEWSANYEKSAKQPTN